jgi:hypothetical protein
VIGKIYAGIIVISAVLAGAAIYYLQVYGYYEEIPANASAAEVRMTTIEGIAEPTARPSAFAPVSAPRKAPRC